MTKVAETHKREKDAARSEGETTAAPTDDQEQQESKLRKFLRIISWEPFRGFHFLLIGYGVLLLGGYHGEDPRTFAVLLAGVATMVVGISFAVTTSRRVAIITLIVIAAYATGYAALVEVEDWKLYKEVNGVNAAWLASGKRPSFPGGPAVGRVQEIIFAPALVLDSMIIRRSKWQSSKPAPELVPIEP